MNPIRILIVDESSVSRDALRKILGADADLEIVAVTGSGKVALARLTELNPDVVLLDVIEPEKEGLKTLAALRQKAPSLPVIMFSQLTDRGSQTTVDALLLGATNYLKKPDSIAELESGIHNELTKKIKNLGTPSSDQSSLRLREGLAGMRLNRVAGTQAVVEKPTRESKVFQARSSRSVELVAIATSTGGPNALASLLSSLPGSFVTPIVIVQHMGAGFTTGLAESLSRQSGRTVRVVDNAQSLTDSTVWIAAGGRHVTVTKRGSVMQVVPNDEAEVNGCRPSADVLFQSVATAVGAHCVAVVLTGMGSDGLAGCRMIRQAGGTILVQDEASSIVWGMPGQVATAGLADMVLPLADISRYISLYANSRPTNAG